jgi:hypothetical protein
VSEEAGDPHGGRNRRGGQRSRRPVAHDCGAQRFRRSKDIRQVDLERRQARQPGDSLAGRGRACGGRRAGRARSGQRCRWREQRDGCREPGSEQEDDADQQDLNAV